MTKSNSNTDSGRFSPWLTIVLRILVLLVLYTLSRLAFYFQNASIFSDITFNDWVWILIGGLRFDVVPVFYLSVLSILIYITPLNQYKWATRTGDVLFIVFNSIGLLANCIDGTYYPFNLKRMTWTALGELQGLNNAGDLFSGFLIRYWYVWALWFFFVLILVWSVRAIKPYHKKYNAHTYVDIFMLTFIILMFGFRGNLRYSTRPLGLNDAGKYVKSPQNIALVFSSPFSIIRTVSESKLKHLEYFKDEAQLEKIYNPEQRVKTEGEFDKMNVIILVLESFSEEASSIGNPDPKANKFMPFVDSLRRKSFYTQFSYANGKKSIEALPTIWGSIPSFTHSYVLSKYSSNQIKGLPHILRDKGYHTSFFHGAPNGSMGFESFANLMGIEHYYGKNEFNDNSHFDGIWGIWDQPFLKYYAKTLKTFKEPFFSTVFTLSSHDPFRVPKGFEDKYPSGPHPIYKVFSYSDDGLRQFFESIKNEPWYNNTLFVISADHTSPQSSDPVFRTSAGVFRIPIFFYAPGRDISGKSERNFQQLDIMPTVLSMLNYTEPFVSFGKDLTNPETQDFAVNLYGNYQYFYKNYLLKMNGDDESIELYNYREDQLLKNNLIGKKKELADSLNTNFKGFIQQFQNRMIDNRFIVK